ncbi:MULTISPECIES: LysR family transcriptional regulator [Shewanella]|uniref:LysR family transcriptional regulator n=2 Tax=Unclassified Bacteria TaxID=49928 RepID=A0AAU6VWB4_UNCXX|nr:MULTISPECIES: LysR family transcriptional regulator [Shewanella]MBO2645795.1 LysR family transcriptional regulator [Shewanella algae]MCT8979469.1 LysR family transcriptional regulator [Shewanella algae]MDE0567472.1 LysR family transcriptional regulator [Shewanella sp. K8]
MDRLTAAEVFVDLAASGSFTATAERLEMSRAMVTRHIKALEDWLGARLLNRTTRSVTLTDAGNQCLTYCRQLLSTREALEISLSERRRQLTGKLRISSSMSFAHARLAASLAQFIRLNPGVEIELDVSDRAVDLVAERVDLVIRIASSPDPLLIGKPLIKVNSQLVASPEYLKQYSAPQHPRDLRQHLCLGYRHFNRNLWHLSKGEQNESVAVNCQLVANEATVLLRAAQAGSGIAQLPDYLLAEALKDGSLQRLLPDWTPRVMTAYALYSSREHMPVALRALIDHLSQAFSG